MGMVIILDISSLNLSQPCKDPIQISHSIPKKKKKSSTVLDADFWNFAKLNYENMPIQIYWKFYHQKRNIFIQKILIFFMFLLKT